MYSIAGFNQVLIALFLLVSLLDWRNAIDILQGELLEPFIDDKLLRKNPKADRCDSLLGCFKEQPEGKSYKNPNSLNTAFKIWNGKHQTHIDYRETILCSSSDSSHCETYPYNLSLLLESRFNPELKTIVVVDGFQAPAFGSWPNRTKDYWQQLEEVNVILVAWNSGSLTEYPQAVGATKIVGRQITVLLYYLAKLNGFELNDEGFTERIHFVGFSLGAQISGFVGYDLDGKVGRITGLDPAGPSFNAVESEDRLDRTDALLVDALHTNSGKSSLVKVYFGIGKAVGHIDLYANDGKTQPSCKYNIFGCSHKQASGLYLSFLDYTIQARRLLPDGDRKYRRLFAIKSDNYQSFYRGESLVNFCPSAIDSESKLVMEALVNCTIPIDFVGGFSYRKELLDEHGILFDQEVGVKNKYYFYTDANYPSSRDSNLLTVSVNSNLEGSDKQTIDCDLTINAIGISHKLNEQSLTSRNNHYEIAVPILSPSKEATLRIAELDVDDETLDKYVIDLNLTSIFSPSLEISGFTETVEETTESSYWNTAKHFFNLFKASNEGRKRDKQCNFHLINATIQPLKKLHRQIVAIYTTNFYDQPKLTILRGEDQFHSGNNFEQSREQQTSTILYLNQIVIGPYDKSLDELPILIDEDPTVETSSVDSAYWILLTVFSLLAFIIIGLFLYYRLQVPRKNLQDSDKLQIVMSIN